MKRVAVVNFARTHYPLASPRMVTFLAMTKAVYRQSEQSEGCIAAAHPVDERDDLSFFEREWGNWGPFVVPDYYLGGTTFETVQEASALSLWADLQSLYRFVYSGMHLRGITQRHSWFEEMAEPGYAIWWTDAHPTWAEGSRRLAHIRSHGETPLAFTFRQPYDASGRSLTTAEIRSAAKRRPVLPSAS